MAKPQQPELRRSGTVPALDPDASESDLEAHKRPGSSGPEGPVPEEQRPGHHPDHEQDKPDLDKFAERMGIVSEDEEPADAPHVEDETPERRSKARTWSPIGLVLVGPVTGILVAKGVIRAIRRFRR